MTLQPRYYAHYLSHRGFHESHPGCPNSLGCLADVDTAPADQPETLVRCAILGSGKGHLSVDDILAALKGKYPFYKNDGREYDLKLSITYTLATSPEFVRQSDGLKIVWAVIDVHAHSERLDLAMQRPMQNARAYAYSTLIGALPTPVTTSHPLGRPPGEPFDGPGPDPAPASRLSSISSVDFVEPPVSPPRVSNPGPPGEYTGAPALLIDEDGQHPPHPDCPSSLSCLQDTNGKPRYTLPIIIRAAILGSTWGRLTITDIYAAIIQKYPHFAALPPDDSWKVCMNLQRSIILDAHEM
ncbi:unnamed protein product [Peniophora sp. CBMAI 1063]|nr:unnamed protein product [Peniophora sp. CBMAI 1063]